MRESSVQPGRQFRWDGLVFEIEGVDGEWVKLKGYDVLVNIRARTQWEMIREEHVSALPPTDRRTKQGRKRRFR